MKAIITVDVEEDNQWQGNKNTLDNLRYLPSFQNLCEKYNFVPIYFLTYGVAVSGYSSWFKKLALKKKAIIGAHFHPWSTPPLVTADQKQRFPSELPAKEFELKLNKLTEAIITNIGIRPLFYRAGKWGFRKEQARILKKYGYKVDFSVTPGINWCHFNKNGPDFSGETLAVKEINGVKEYPMTILNIGRLANIFSFYQYRFQRRKNDLVKRILNKIIYQQRWFRILPPINLKELKKVINKAEKEKLPYIMFMIHSSELMPGGSPYFKTREAVRELNNALEEIFYYLRARQIKNYYFKE